jgi:hypothetical protein
MLLLRLPRALFKFNADNPASEALFQLPPRIGRRNALNPVLRV